MISSYGSPRGIVRGSNEDSYESIPSKGVRVADAWAARERVRAPHAVETLWGGAVRD